MEEEQGEGRCIAVYSSIFFLNVEVNSLAECSDILNLIRVLNLGL